MCLANIVGVIPAYNPNETLIRLVEILRNDIRIVIVNDGSENAELFEQLSVCQDATVLAFPANQGKGAALKKAFRYVLDQYPDCTGVVTFDADGQHLPTDILKIAHNLEESESSLIIGVRNFSNDVPMKSRIGNKLTRVFMQTCFDISLSDTQCGLRGIPKLALHELLRIPSCRYEFETDMLLTAKKIGLSFQQVPIQTVYHDANRNSNFHPVLD